MSNIDKNSTTDDEVDLKELFLILWAKKLMIIAITCIAALVSILVALSQPNVYTSSALLAPAESSGGGLSGLMKQYGGLASLAGVSLPGGDAGSRAQFGMELMKSRAFIADFVARREILPDLVAVKRWDPASGKLVYDPERYDVAAKSWLSAAESSALPQPSTHEAYKAFSSILGISEDKMTGYISVSIEHESPVVAAQWVGWLIEDVNAAVKAQDVEEATKSIEYLKQQVVNTSLADLQTRFSELIQSQIETVMLAEVRSEYVFKTIDPAVIPEERSRPNRALICILGTFFGGVLGVVIVVMGRYARSFADTDNR